MPLQPLHPEVAGLHALHKEPLGGRLVSLSAADPRAPAFASVGVPGMHSHLH
jgi:hypothetical protein